MIIFRGSRLGPSINKVRRSALSGREEVMTKAYICCFYNVILLFKSLRYLKITKFERTYFTDGPFADVL